MAIPMKTLHLTNAYHATSGGIRTFYEALLRDAEPHGRHVRLVVPGPEDRVEDLSPYARIYTIAAPPSPFVDRRYRLLLPHRFLRPDRGPVWKILREEQPDLIEICDKYAFCYLAGVLRTRAGRRPVLAGLSCERMDDGLRAFGGGRLARRFARWYLKRVYVPQLDVHIANSHYTASELPFKRAIRGPCSCGRWAWTLPPSRPIVAATTAAPRCARVWAVRTARRCCCTRGACAARRTWICCLRSSSG